MRSACLERKTLETGVSVDWCLDGSGVCEINTGIGFFDHMLTLLAKHSFSDLNVQASGDLDVDSHHTVEDCGIVLGQAIAQALGDKRGITRYASIALPMDETLVLAAVDISGRGACYPQLSIPAEQVGNFDTELGVELFIALAANAGITLHIQQLAGANSHHILEAAFKAVARALSAAVAIDPRIEGVLPTTKGAL